MKSPHYLATAAVVAVALSSGNDAQCQQGMDLLSRSAHIVSIKPVDPGATEAQ